MNAVRQVIASHHGLNGIGNKTTITHTHQGQAVFVVVAGSNFNSPLTAHQLFPFKKWGDKGDSWPVNGPTNSYPIGTFTPVFFANAIASG
jgi:hypothetical protein